MTEIDKRLINVFKDIDNLKGLEVWWKDDIIELDLSKKKHPTITYGIEGENTTMFPYLFMVGLEEGWLKVEVDEAHPKNKLRYINKLLNKYGEEV